jgi:hypothetical protein
MSIDFLVDGESLLQTLVRLGGGHSDFMGCFVKGYPEQNGKCVDKLLAHAKPDTENGRVLLYICPECGDVGCGAYAARVTKTDEYYIWSDFAYENGYEDAQPLDNIGPFNFERSVYENIIRHAAAL